MPDDPDIADQTSPFSVGSVYPAVTGATNPELAKEFLQQHRADSAARQPDIDAVMGKMQLSTDTMTKMLDDTTAAIKSSRRNQSNLPLLAMAAGMLSSRGNFGNQLGAGLSAVIPTVQKDRENDDQMQYQLANLGLKKQALEQAPLEAKLAYMKALQVGDLQATRAIEQALIRAQATGGSNSAANPKLIQKTLQDAISEARKQVDNWAKDMDISGEEKETEYKRRLAENLRAAQASGIPIPEDVIRQVTGGGTPIPGATPGAAPGPGMSKFKSYFDSPNTPDRQKITLEAGLPAPPTGYLYDSVGRAERPKLLAENNKEYQKETKDFDETSANMRTQMDQINQMKGLMDKYPKLTGPVRGIIPNSWEPNVTSQARLLDSLLKSQQLHNIPKGQGAVSNMERELFASAGANMGSPAEANKQILAIQEEVIRRDLDKRAFFNDYFNHYRTMDGMKAAWDRYIYSPEGSAFKREHDTIVPNTNRTPWREFFRKERMTGQKDAGNRATGGYIKLGDEYDD